MACLAHHATAAAGADTAPHGLCTTQVYTELDLERWNGLDSSGMGRHRKTSYGKSPRAENIRLTPHPPPRASAGSCRAAVGWANGMRGQWLASEDD
jgi:hypothetical protein